MSTMINAKAVLTLTKRGVMQYDYAGRHARVKRGLTRGSKDGNKEGKEDGV
jgi:hypothetical protein